MSSRNVVDSKERQETESILMPFARSCTTTEKLVSKVHVSESPPMRPEQGWIEYMKAKYQGREQLLKRNARVVVRKNELKFFRQSYVDVYRNIRNDPHLHGNMSLYPAINQQNRGTIFRAVAQRGVIAQNREHTLGDHQGPVQAAPDCLKNYRPTYFPPKHRIKITNNITFNSNDVIPVYSDLPNETVESLSIPDSILYDYTDINFFNKFAEYKLAKAVQMSQEEQNTIRCNCCSSEPIVNCYDNPECPCSKVNKRMQFLQNSAANYPVTEFTTFKPIIFSQVKDHFQKYCGFACSELCGCKGNCTNNSLLIPSKKIFPIEMYRSIKKIGFGIRSPVLIPAGTPLFEFVGELVQTNKMERGNSDYAYQISYKWDKNWKELLKATDQFTEEYKAFLVNLCDKEFFIDPKVYGNVGRTACHSCSANLEVVRVFQKSLSPAHIRLVMVSLIDIYPGTPLTLDYGANYIATSFNGKCECGTIPCPSGKDFKIFKDMNFTDYTVCHRTLNDWQYENWRKNIYEFIHKVSEQEPEAITID